MRYRLPHLATLAALAALAGAAPLVGACNDAPPDDDYTPLYRSPGDEGPTSGERGSVMISEIHWAGSVNDEGVHDWDDVFIELKSQEERPLDITDWRIRITGDVSRTYEIPEVDDPLQPNEYFVIAAQEDGAFGEAADVIIEDLELGRHFTEIELVDSDKRLMGGGGSTSQRHFAGAWDTVTARSMERVQLIFANSGSVSRSWHTYSANSGVDAIPEEYRDRTLASPGTANSTDYSGSTASGSFE